ncbi:hypothetical protein [Streptomyces sp. CC219B]|uniref:hypothetical protein n=1 Tax=Streptomyces sp. CC219B TaxID=3044574 RepID=UPI0024A7F8BF|nr:hypothetical protein [Streptomyces sp. CC219B]
MDVTITVRVCDICKRRDRPATRYTLTPEDGTPKTRDLCAEDVAPVEKVFGPLAPAEEEAPGPLYLNAAEEGAGEARPAAKKTTARKTTAKKATAKKTAAGGTTRRRGKTPVKTLDEIEAEKRARANQS